MPKDPSVILVISKPEKVETINFQGFCSKIKLLPLILSFKNKKDMEKVLDLLEIKALFPNEWVLIGNPTFDDSKLEVLSGIPLFHSEDKKEVCYIGRDKTVGFNKITLIYTGKLKSSRKITGIFNRITK